MTAQERPQPRTVLVTGDLIWDYNLLQYPTRPVTHREELPDAGLVVSRGGAWYVGSLVTRACCDLDVDVVTPVEPAPDCPADQPKVNQAYQVWSLHNRVRDRKDLGQVWRISSFLGCCPADGGKEPPRAEEEFKEPDVLVLDDLGLDFRDAEGRWLACLREGDGPSRIVLKLSGEVGVGPLWQRLKEEFADRLTVVVSARALRERGAALSQGLSWDRTIEEIVHEFEHGASARDLALCRRVIVHFGGEGAACFSRVRLVFPEPPDASPDAPVLPQEVLEDRAQFERFLYRPDELEGMWKADRPGQTFGAMSILAAALARHELAPESYPLFLALGRGLAAVRLSHDIGCTGANGFSTDEPLTAIRDMFHPPEKPGAADPVAAFQCAFPHHCLADEGLGVQPVSESDLLRDLTGRGFLYVLAKAVEVVVWGPVKALRRAPVAKYGKYLTADREEIERINAVRNLILAYQGSPRGRKPLALAVFGPPGSGKSFAIKQLAAELFGPRKAVLEFNLSQIRDEDELHTAFHQVRDASVHGQVPLVFWDEFDTTLRGRKLGWLRCFLAPLQDAKFRAGATEHPFGKAIFIFAGGTNHTFEAFDRTGQGGTEKGDVFQESKGPDFVSRLKGYVNIKGPNAVPPGNARPRGAQAEEAQPGPEEEVACLIRRAIILRVSIEADYPQLIDPETGMASVSAGVVRAFLRVKRYCHGARSISALVGMSSVGEGRQYGAAHLPSRDMLKLHVDAEDFMEHVRQGELGAPAIEALAEACHTAWKEQKEGDGWRYGPERSDEKKTHPLLVEYGKLAEADKERNRESARVVSAKLDEVGCRIAPADAEGQKANVPDVCGSLMKIEHDIWLRHHLLDGYAWADVSCDRLRLHKDVAPFNAVSPGEQKLDQAIVESIPDALRREGYRIVKA